MEKTKLVVSLTPTRPINELRRCPSIDVNAMSRVCHATDALRVVSVWKLNIKTKWVCIQLACSRPRALEEAHHRNIQAKFYNKKFPLVYESDNLGDSLYEKHGATLKHECGKDSNNAPSLLFFHFFGFFSWAPFGLFFSLFSTGVASLLVGES